MNQPQRMRLTIVGPYDGKLLQDFLNGKPVSLKGHKGYKVYVDGAYEEAQKRASNKADSQELHN